jgi:hypothetical protein
MPTLITTTQEDHNFEMAQGLLDSALAAQARVHDWKAKGYPESAAIAEEFDYQCRAQYQTYRHRLINES